MSDTAGDQATARKLVTVEDVEAAHKRILQHVHRTPLLTSSTLDALATAAINGAEGSKQDGQGDVQIRLAFKSEHLQRVGAFKMRGATNAVQTHLERLRRETNGAFQASNLWVVTHSSGNHAAAVACAARSVGARAAVVMPKTAPAVKKAAVAGYGATIVECEPTQAAREQTANDLIKQLQAQDAQRHVEFVHPYDEALVIAGQGTLGLEMLQQARALGEGRRRCSESQADRSDEHTWSARDESDEPVLDIVVPPVGGGGMLSGVSTAVRGKDDRIVVVAAEPLHADDAARSFHSGVLQPAISPPQTICDGLLTALSPFTLKHVQKNVRDILTASEDEIIGALQLVWERMKQIIEPSAAVGLAVILNNPKFVEYVREVAEQKRSRQKNRSEPVQVRIGVVWTGGNVEVEKVAQLIAARRGTQ